MAYRGSQFSIRGSKLRGKNGFGSAADRCAATIQKIEGAIECARRRQLLGGDFTQEHRLASRESAIPTDLPKIAVLLAGGAVVIRE